jgi:hypothetical protein
MFDYVMPLLLVFYSLYMGELANLYCFKSNNKLRVTVLWIN